MKKYIKIRRMLFKNTNQTPPCIWSVVNQFCLGWACLSHRPSW